MARKVILCRCEDVTLADVQHAVALGYADVEEVKRYTGFGTGPCQGKECLRGVVAAIADGGRARARDAGAVHVAAAARADGAGGRWRARRTREARRAGSALAHRVDRTTPTSRSSAPGVMGLALAYNLASDRAVGRQAHRRRRRPLPGLGRVGPQRRRRAPAVVDRDERPPDAGVDRHLRALREADAHQRLDAPGRLPVPRAHAGGGARAWSATSRCRTAAACATRMIAPEEARALVPELDDRAQLRRRLLQPDRRHRVSVAVPVGLRARGREARRRDPHEDAGHGDRAPRRQGGGGFRVDDAGGHASPPSGSSARPAPGRRRSRAWWARRCPIARSATRSSRPSR